MQIVSKATTFGFLIFVYFTMQGIEYLYMKPVKELNDLVEGFWMITNRSSEAYEIIVLPDGRIDLSFSFTDPNMATLIGLETVPSKTIFKAGASMFVISFKLPAVEYLLKRKFPDLPDHVESFPTEYFGITLNGFKGFEDHIKLFSDCFLNICHEIPDPRKKTLFELIYSSAGQKSISELSEHSFWSSRQINRYFNDWFGLSLKAYCNILRFRESFTEISRGNLYPSQNYSDQAHFIKDVKKFAGVTPGELNRNDQGKFIQISTLKTG